MLRNDKNPIRSPVASEAQVCASLVIPLEGAQGSATAHFVVSKRALRGIARPLETPIMRFPFMDFDDIRSVRGIRLAGTLAKLLTSCWGPLFLFKLFIYLPRSKPSLLSTLFSAFPFKLIWKRRVKGIEE